MGGQRLLFPVDKDFFRFTSTLPVISVSLLILTISLLLTRLKIPKKYVSSSLLFFLMVLVVIHYNFINFQIRYDRNINCFDISTGRLKWKNNDLMGPKYNYHPFNSLASPTSVITDYSIVSYFGETGLICIDKTKGNTLWINNNLHFRSYYGAASSPVVCDNKIYLLHGNEIEQKISCLDFSTGKIIWQNNIEGAMIYRPPLINEINGNKCILCITNKKMFIYNSADGSTLCINEFENIGGDLVSSAIKDPENPEIVYLSGRNTTVAFNLKNADTGNLIKWRTKLTGANCVSPVTFKQNLYILSDNGLLSCLNKESGSLIFQEKFHGTFYSSLSRLGKYLYLTNMNGTTYVVEIDGDEIKRKSQNDLNDDTYSSIAIAYNKLFFRTKSNLVCIN